MDAWGSFLALQDSLAACRFATMGNAIVDRGFPSVSLVAGCSASKSGSMQRVAAVVKDTSVWCDRIS